MKEVINTTTGNREIQFTGRLMSISPDVVGSTPNGKDYRVATIEFKNSKGVKTQATTLVFENNFKYGMEIGVEYQSRAILTPGQTSPLLVTSHLTGATRASFDDFGINAEDLVEVKTPEVKA